MVVGIYIRVSTDEQAQEGYSISAQKERLKAFCIAQNWTEHKFYIDEGISGRNTNRPNFKKLLDDIKNGSINILLVYRLDRLTRSVRDLHETLDFLDKYNCVFRSATEIYDTSTAMGRMFITIVAAIAEWESANLGERVVMGQLEKARQGEWAAQPPYGWYKDEKHKLHINKDEIEAVKLMVKKVRDGLSFRQLSFYMDNTKYKPRRGYKWHITTLLELMHNPVLYGAMYWGGEVYENTHEGIMSKKEFEELQQIISSRKLVKKRHVNSEFIYQTKIVCPHCGNRLSCERNVWKNKDGTEKSSHSYRCQACALNNKDCKPFMIQEKKITDAIIEYTKDIKLISTENLFKVKSDNGEIEEIKSELKIIERQREKFQKAWSMDLMKDEEFTKLMHESRTRYDDLQKQLKELDSNYVDSDILKKNIEVSKDIAENFMFLTQSEKRDFVQRTVKSIELRILNETTKGKYRKFDIEIASLHFY